MAGDTLLIQRHALHCRTLRFRQPLTGAWLQVTAPIPPDLASLLPQNFSIERHSPVKGRGYFGIGT